MKISFLIIAGVALFALLAFKVLGINSFNTGKESEISFHQGSWSEALELAKNENKLIFLNISASWCGPCKMLKSRTFSNTDAGHFYNTHFINVAVDGEIGEGITLAQRYAIKGYPSLLFVDANGNLVAKTAGYHSPQNFIELGKQIIKK
ncbi:MAG: thioredoxin family protein [Bacteroidetes bacterium]|nr:MAG: thioredoxin family protein [Bacteroidota bacterium]